MTINEEFSIGPAKNEFGIAASTGATFAVSVVDGKVAVCVAWDCKNTNGTLMDVLAALDKMKWAEDEGGNQKLIFDAKVRILQIVAARAQNSAESTCPIQSTGRYDFVTSPTSFDWTDSIGKGTILEIPITLRDAEESAGEITVKMEAVGIKRQGTGFTFEADLHLDNNKRVSVRGQCLFSAEQKNYLEFDPWRLQE